jgi:hypothetical protein
MTRLVYDTICERCSRLAHCRLIAGELICEACIRGSLARWAAEQTVQAALTLDGERERLEAEEE